MDQHPLPVDLEEKLRHDAEGCGLADLWPGLRALARPCYAVELVPDADLDRRGTSRLGGLPDLPSGRDWPQREGQLLTFIGQVNLAEVPGLPVPLPLPDRGMLYFFLGVDEPASNIVHEVLFWDGPPDQLTRPEEPDESAFLNEDCTLFRPAGVRFLPAVSLPETREFFDRPDSGIGGVSVAGLSPDDFSDRLEELRDRLEAPSAPSRRSQLLGHPLVVSGDPLAEAYVAVHRHANIIYDLHRTPDDIDRDLADAEAEGDDDRVAWNRRRRESLVWFHTAREHHRREIAHWQLLLEVASHRQCGMCWWDAGRLQFLIDTRDLASRDFSRTYACVQTS